MKAFLSSLKRFWAVYALFLVLSPLLALWGSNLITRAKDYEKIGIFAGGRTVDDTKMSSLVLEKMPSLVETNVFPIDPISNSYKSYFLSAGVVSSDVFVVPTKSLSDVIFQSYFLELSSDSWKAFSSVSLTPFSVEGRIYGFLVSTVSNSLLLDSFMSYSDEDSQDYMIGFNRNSTNLSGLTPLVKEGTDHAIMGLKYLIDYQGEEA